MVAVGTALVNLVALPFKGIRLLLCLHIAAAFVQLQQLPIKQFSQSSTLRMTGTQAVAIPADTGPAPLQIETRHWQWRDYTLRYQVAGEDTAGPAMILVTFTCSTSACCMTCPC
jgi:hypothetical protein